MSYVNVINVQNILYLRFTAESNRCRQSMSKSISVIQQNVGNVFGDISKIFLVIIQINSHVH